jgi:hypothetical protein
VILHNFTGEGVGDRCGRSMRSSRKQSNEQSKGSDSKFSCSESESESESESSMTITSTPLSFFSIVKEVVKVFLAPGGKAIRRPACSSCTYFFTGLVRQMPFPGKYDRALKRMMHGL